MLKQLLYDIDNKKQAFGEYVKDTEQPDPKPQGVLLYNALDSFSTYVSAVCDYLDQAVTPEEDISDINNCLANKTEGSSDCGDIAFNSSDYKSFKDGASALQLSIDGSTLKWGSNFDDYKTTVKNVNPITYTSVKSAVGEYPCQYTRTPSPCYKITFCGTGTDEELQDAVCNALSQHSIIGEVIFTDVILPDKTSISVDLKKFPDLSHIYIPSDVAYYAIDTIRPPEGHTIIVDSNKWGGRVTISHLAIDLTTSLFTGYGSDLTQWSDLIGSNGGQVMLPPAIETLAIKTPGKIPYLSQWSDTEFGRIDNTQQETVLLDYFTSLDSFNIEFPGVFFDPTPGTPLIYIQNNRSVVDYGLKEFKAKFNSAPKYTTAAYQLMIRVISSGAQKLISFTSGTWGTIDFSQISIKNFGPDLFGWVQLNTIHMPFYFTSFDARFNTNTTGVSIYTSSTPPGGASVGQTEADFSKFTLPENRTYALGGDYTQQGKTFKSFSLGSNVTKFFPNLTGTGVTTLTMPASLTEFAPIGTLPSTLTTLTFNSTGSLSITGDLSLTQLTSLTLPMMLNTFNPTGLPPSLTKLIFKGDGKVIYGEDTSVFNSVNYITLSTDVVAQTGDIFKNFIGLKTIELGSLVKSFIPNKALAQTNLTLVLNSGSVSATAESSFYDNITSILFATTVTNITMDFSNFTNVTSLGIPKSATIDANANLGNITTLIFTDGIPTIGTNLKKSQITKIILNSSTKIVDFDLSKLTTATFPYATVELDASVTGFNPKDLPADFALTLNSPSITLCTSVSCTNLTSITLNTTTTTDWSDLNPSKLTNLTTIKLSGTGTTFFPPTKFTKLPLNATGFSGTFDFSKVSWDAFDQKNIKITTGSTVSGLTLPACTTSTCSLNLVSLGIPTTSSLTFTLDLTKTTATATINFTAPTVAGSIWCYDTNDNVTVLNQNNWMKCPTPSNPNIPAVCATTSTDPQKKYCEAIKAMNPDPTTTPSNWTEETLVKSQNFPSLNTDKKNAALELGHLYDSIYNFYSQGCGAPVATSGSSDDYKQCQVNSKINYNFPSEWFCKISQVGTPSTEGTTCNTQYPIGFYVCLLNTGDPLIDKWSVKSGQAVTTIVPDMQTFTTDQTNILSNDGTNPFGTGDTCPATICGVEGVYPNNQWSFYKNAKKITDAILVLVEKAPKDQ